VIDFDGEYDIESLIDLRVMDLDLFFAYDLDADLYADMVSVVGDGVVSFTSLYLRSNASYSTCNWWILLGRNRISSA